MLFPPRMRKQQPLLMLVQHTWSGRRNQKHKKAAVPVRVVDSSALPFSALPYFPGKSQHRWGRREPYLSLRGMYRMHPMHLALCWAFCSAHRETHSIKVLVLWSIFCPASSVPCGTSPSQESCDPKIKGSVGHLHLWAEPKHRSTASFGRAVTPERQCHTDPGGVVLGEICLKWKRRL